MSEGRWFLNIEPRRTLFDWEVEQWNSLLGTLNLAPINEDFNDLLIWCPNATGKYTPRSFCCKYCMDNETPSNDWKSIWAGLMPPKVEIFCWQLLHGKIAMKQILANRNLFKF